MRHMDKLTLDTNALRDWAWADGLTAEQRHQGAQRDELRAAYVQLTKLRDAGRCELAVPPQISLDFAQSSGNPPAPLAALIGTVVELTTPSLTTFPIHFPAVYFDDNAFNAIFRIVYPSAKIDDARYENHQRDTLLLYAHWVASRDIFITSDKAILNAGAELRKNRAITVSGIREYIARA
jgi:hypothetical protein